MNSSDLHLETYPVGHLPVMRAAMEKLGLIEILDRLLPQHALSRVSDASCITVMLLNILSGRLALFRMDEWLSRTDTGLLLGEGLEADAFNDTRLALALDHLDAVGTDCVMGEVVQAYLSQEDRPTAYSVHQDTTSITLYGAYEACGEPIVTYGHSKARRPDLKQLIFGLSLHGAVGLPLVSSVTAGNTSDQAANRAHLSRLAALLPNSDEVTVVADCKAVDADTVGRVLGAGFHLVSLVPDTFALRGQLIDSAWSSCADSSQWPELASRPGRRKADPHMVYRGQSVLHPFPVKLRRPEDDEATLSIEEMRMLVVHSSALASKFEAALPARIEKELTRTADFERRTGRKGFGCEGDAKAAAEKHRATLRFHTAQVIVEPHTQTQKRAGPGRPPAGSKVPTKTVWKVRYEMSRDEPAIEQARRRASCFVLITDWLEEEDRWSDADVLACYRHQYLVENHTGFRWLKSEALVAPMFLKKTTRIRAMGLVLILALMVRNYLQFTLRASLEEQEETLPHPFTKKQENNLTTEMAMEWFAEVVIVHTAFGDGPLTRNAPLLRAPALRILGLLKIPTSCFSHPPKQRPPPSPPKLRGRLNPTPGM
jgi:transposase